MKPRYNSNPFVTYSGRCKVRVTCAPRCFQVSTLFGQVLSMFYYFLAMPRIHISYIHHFSESPMSSESTTLKERPILLDSGDDIRILHSVIAAGGYDPPAMSTQEGT